MLSRTTTVLRAQTTSNAQIVRDPTWRLQRLPQKINMKRASASRTPGSWSNLPTTTTTKTYASAATGKHNNRTHSIECQTELTWLKGDNPTKYHPITPKVAPPKTRTQPTQTDFSEATPPQHPPKKTNTNSMRPLSKMAKPKPNPKPTIIINSKPVQKKITRNKGDIRRTSSHPELNNRFDPLDNMETDEFPREPHLIPPKMTIIKSKNAADGVINIKPTKGKQIPHKVGAENMDTGQGSK